MPTDTSHLRELEDRELVARVKQELPETHAAFTALAARYRDFVIGRACRILGSRSDAEDAAQDVWVALLHALPGYRPDRPFRNWLSVVVRNTCCMRLRSRARERRRGDELAREHELVGPGGQQAASDPILDRVLVELLAGLPAPTRAALELRLLDELSYREVADELEISESAAKMRVQRGCERLRQAWADRLPALDVLTAA